MSERVLDVDYDPAVWVAVPLDFPDGDWEFAQDWADEVTDGFVEDGVLTPAARADLASQLVANATFFADHPDLTPYLHLPRVDQEPLAVTVELLEAEGDTGQALRELTGADDEQVVEPVQVEPVDVPGLGTGIRVLRFIDDDGLVVCVDYAWRVDDVDVHVAASTDDLPRLLGALDDIAAFAAGMRLS